MAFLSGRLSQRLALCAAAVLLPFFFVGGPDWASDPLYKSAWNLGHILFFGTLTLAIRPQQWLDGWRLWLASSAVVLVAGCIIELLQGDLGRQSDIQDVFRNLVGMWLVMSWVSPLSFGNFPAALNCALKWLLRAGAIVLLVFQLQAVFDVARQQYRVAHQLPLVYDFNTTGAWRYWNGDVWLAEQHTENARYSLRLKLSTDHYSGTTLHNLPANWTGYDRLYISMYNPASSPITLNLRINDVAHDRGDNAFDDRYNTKLTLKPGTNRFHLSLDDVRTAPATREMDMDDIRRLMIFTAQLDKPRTVFVTGLRLEHAEKQDYTRANENAD
ncbi:succinyl-CoA synthetase subunit beta [Marinobacter sp. 1Y8]